MLTDSSGTDFDFSALKPAADAPNEPESTDRVPDEKICPVCGLPIYKAPGARGRMPKYHPDCRPSASKRVGDVLGGTRRTSPVADAKRGREADECIAFVKPKLVQGATALMLFDQFDGFVIMTAIPGICENLHGILVSHDGFRKQMLLAKSGGSIFGLIVTLAIPVAAICANHGLIPSARIADILKNVPLMLHKISIRMREGEASMADMMNRVADKVMEEEEKKRAANVPGNTGTPTEQSDVPDYLRTSA